MHFTKYSVAVATKNQTAKTTAEALLNNFIFGNPTKLLSDQGANFDGEIIRELCQLMGIEKIRTTVYHPQCNGIAEIFNKTLLNMIGTLEPEKKANWKHYLPSLSFAYNAMKHESTGYTPFELMYGRKPRLAIDTLFQIENNDQISTDYVNDLKKKLETARNIANKTLEQKRNKQKLLYDRKANAATIHVGDKVLVKNTSIQWTS